MARSFLVAAEAERCVATAQAEVRVSTAPLDAQHAHHVAGLVVVRQAVPAQARSCSCAKPFRLRRLASNGAQPTDREFR